MTLNELAKAITDAKQYIDGDKEIFILAKLNNCIGYFSVYNLEVWEECESPFAHKDFAIIVPDFTKLLIEE